MTMTPVSDGKGRFSRLRQPLGQVYFLIAMAVLVSGAWIAMLGGPAVLITVGMGLLLTAMLMLEGSSFATIAGLLTWAVFEGRTLVLASIPAWQQLCWLCLASLLLGLVFLTAPARPRPE